MKAIDKIRQIKVIYLQGKIDIDEARAMTKPLIEIMNVQAEKLAKEFGRKHKKFIFTNIFR